MSTAGERVDAVVVGAGPNGLTAAALLADAGWDVLVLEAQPEPGGAVRTAELHPGYRADLFSAFYPLAAVSPVFTELDLPAHGLSWSRSPAAFGHPRAPEDEDAVTLRATAQETAQDLERRCAGDGDAWMCLHEQWSAIREPFLRMLLGPFPPIRSPLTALRRLGPGEALRFARMLALPVRRMAQELFGGESAGLLFQGNAAHADIPVDAAGSGLMGYLLTMVGQDVGFPVPTGGAGELTAALVRRATSAGAELRCGREVERLELGDGPTTVRTTGGERITARRAVLADVSATALYGKLLPPEALPDRVRRDLQRFEWDTSVVKVNYAMSQPIPWRSPSLRSAGTVHLGADGNGLVRWGADLGTGTVPRSPFVVLGQMTTADPTRSPTGTESAWAYTHLPRGVSDDDAATALAQRMDETLEEYAPGALANVVHRSVQLPGDLERADANLVGGAVNGGTAQLHQQLVFRPLPGLAGPRTAVDRVYLAGAAAHPGGGVHGMCGAHAAAAALADHGVTGRLRGRVRGMIAHALAD
ncbi:phytoene desaturase family protein [Rhodococcus zopfii]|uniref:phytoene desaturase family protein n=1 Tax=Rhodococcus zopfii TaxID=43772 RepID=UPI0011115770|nr:NAD(P)/FAD-dependent oxidoreductase [Rhodococcus zopfii]